MLYLINKYLGWRNWSVLVYNSVIENVFVIFYIALADQYSRPSLIIDFFIYCIFSSFCTTYGYLINDFADRELDALHGKENTFAHDSRSKTLMVLLSVLTVCVITSLPFIGNPFFVPLVLIWFVLATEYSVKPFRLKEQGKLGLILVVIAQRALPTLITFAAFKHYESDTVALFTMYILFRGLSSDLNHQLEDYRQDLSTGTATYAVAAGIEKGQQRLRFSLESEKLLLLLCLLLIYHNLSYLTYRGISLVVPLLLTYIVLYGTSIYKTCYAGPDYYAMNPFVPSRKNLFQFLHHAFPSVLLPLYLLLLLASLHYSFLLLLMFFILIRRLYSPQIIHHSYPAQLLSYVLKNIQQILQPKT